MSRRFTRADIIVLRPGDPGYECARQLCLQIERAMEPFRNDPACAPYFDALARLEAEAAAAHIPTADKDAA